MHNDLAIVELRETFSEKKDDATTVHRNPYRKVIRRFL